MAKADVVVRPYHLGDLDAMVKGIVEEVPKLPNYQNIEVDPARVAYLLRHNHGNSGYFQAWVLEDTVEKKIVGGGAGYCVQGFLSFDLVANDAFLYVYPEYRTLRHCLWLMTAYKNWALARGAKLIMASQTGGYRVEAMNEIMRRQGYVECGYQWMLRMDTLNRPAEAV